MSILDSSENEYGEEIDVDDAKFLATFEVHNVIFEGKKCILLELKCSENPFDMADKALKTIKIIMPIDGAVPLGSFILEAGKG